MSKDHDHLLRQYRQADQDDDDDSTTNSTMETTEINRQDAFRPKLDLSLINTSWDSSSSLITSQSPLDAPILSHELNSSIPNDGRHTEVQRTLPSLSQHLAPFSPSSSTFPPLTKSASTGASPLGFQDDTDLRAWMDSLGSSSRTIKSSDDIGFVASTNKSTFPPPSHDQSSHSSQANINMKMSDPNVEWNINHEFSSVATYESMLAGPSDQYDHHPAFALGVGDSEHSSFVDQPSHVKSHIQPRSSSIFDRTHPSYTSHISHTSHTPHASHTTHTSPISGAQVSKISSPVRARANSAGTSPSGYSTGASSNVTPPLLQNNGPLLPPPLRRTSSNTTELISNDDILNIQIARKSSVASVAGAGDKQFQCKMCPLSFRRNHDLKRHLKIHLPVRPYRCTQCLKSFNRKDALKRHLNSNACKKTLRLQPLPSETSPTQSDTLDLQSKGSSETNKSGHQKSFSSQSDPFLDYFDFDRNRGGREITDSSYNRTLESEAHHLGLIIGGGSSRSSPSSTGSSPYALSSSYINPASTLMRDTTNNSDTSEQGQH